MFKVLASRDAFEYPLIEQIREHPLLSNSTSIADLILFHLESLIGRGLLVSDSEWQAIKEIFQSPRKTNQSISIKKTITKLYLEYKKKHERNTLTCHKLKRYTNPPKVSVILLNWSDPKDIHALKSLSKQSYPRHRYEIIWIDYFSQVIQAVEKMADVVISCNQTGVSDKFSGYKIGLEHAVGQWIVVSHNKAVFSSNFIESIIDSPDLIVFFDINEDELKESIITDHQSSFEYEVLGRLKHLEILLANKDIIGAQQETLSLVTQFKNSATVWRIRAIVLREANQFTEALSAIDRSLQLEETPQALIEMARIFKASGDEEHTRRTTSYLNQRFPGQINCAI